MNSIDSHRYLFDQFPTLPIPEWMEDSIPDEPTTRCPKPNHHRSIWISDVHLGTSAAKAEQLSDFLKFNRCDTLYLLGDIFDGWRMKKRVYWPQAHINVIRRILTASKRGTKVVYITGNHDEFLRRYSGMSFGNIHLVDEFVHQSPSGKRFWLVHGDAYDAVVFNKKWLVMIGDFAYDFLLKINPLLNRARAFLGMPQWSLSSYLKNRLRNAFSIINNYEKILSNECKKRNLDGVICGHIHHAELKQIDGVDYANCGDWVESCSALTEGFDGEIQIVHWFQTNSVSVNEEQLNSEPA